jgi:drug/metabolite transporter (DMT)-like permease
LPESEDLEGAALGWRNGSYVGVLLVALGAALWGTDAILRVPLLEVMSPPAIVLGEHLVLLLYSVPAVVLGWEVFRSLGASQWVALLVIAWGGSALATLLFTTAFVLGNPTVVILLQKTQPLFAIALAHLLLRERLRPAYWPCFAVAVLGAYLISFGGFVEPFEALSSVQALPVLWVIVLAQGSLGQMGAGFAVEPARVVLLALVPGLLALLLYYRGLSGTKASYATLAEISFPASAVVLNWTFLGVAVSANQILGFALLWGAILALGYLNARDPAPTPPVGEFGAGGAG